MFVSVLVYSQLTTLDAKNILCKINKVSDWLVISEESLQNPDNTVLQGGFNPTEQYISL